MPYPNYTEAEITAKLTELDEAIAEILKTPLKFSIGDTDIDNTKRLQMLQAERERWEAKYDEVAGDTSSVVQGPRRVLTGG